MSADVSTTTARAWAVRRADGLELGFTDHDAALRFGGIIFQPRAGMAARALTQGTGLSVDNSEAVGVLSDDAITERDLRAGRWDGATMRLWEVDWSNPSRRSLLFRGSLGEIVASGGGFRAELRGLTEALNQPQGRVFHPRCSAVLGDAACGVDLDRPGYAADGVISRLISETEWIVSGFEGHDPGWFAGGRLSLLGGAGEGLEAAVRQDEALPGGRRRIVLWASPGIVPEAGDGLRLRAGCDKSSMTCRMKFNNFLNYRGFPHLPGEDWLLAPQNVPARAGASVWGPGGTGGIVGGGGWGGTPGGGGGETGGAGWGAP